LQLDGSNSAVQPKLALIRTLFSAEVKGQKPGPSNQSSGPVTTAPSAAAPAAPRPATVIPTAPPAPPPPAPVAPAPAAAPAPTAPAATQTVPVSAAEKEVEQAVRAWAGAWSAKDVPSYLAAYGKDFDPPGKQTRKAWEDDRRARIVGKSRISVKLSNVSVAVKGSKATAKFKQDYSADALHISSRKTLDLAKAGERWLIVRESTGS
jgi:ketosteroid isomerase-like protein